MRVVLASGNRGKLLEFSQLLSPLALELVPQSAFGVTPPDETGTTFEANALLKARYAAALSGLPALADDSGLEVDALGGAPGVFSARYAGAHASDADNMAKLLGELRARHIVCGPDTSRARFRCVIALLRGADDAEPRIASGSWEGFITDAPRGTGGFGYDPLFVDSESGLTAAELTSSIKNARSHRGAALRSLLAMGPL